MIRAILLPIKIALVNRRYALHFVSHWFYNIVGFGERALPAPVAELDRYPPWTSLNTSVGTAIKTSCEVECSGGAPHRETADV